MRMKWFTVPVTGLLILAMVLAGRAQSVTHLPTRVHPSLVQAAATATASAGLPVIIRAGVDYQAAVRAVVQAGGEITGNWPLIGSLAATLTPAQLGSVLRSGTVSYVYADALVVPTGQSGDGGEGGREHAYPWSVKADVVWNTYGIQGGKFTVAVVDSGFSDNGDIGGGRVRAMLNFSSRSASNSDAYGHGSHVAGIIAGNGSQSSGQYIGVAPRQELVSLKVSGDDGSLLESDVINALQWLYKNRTKYSIRVVNISFRAAERMSYLDSAMCAYLEQLWRAGVTVVVSAGNDGPDSMYYPPANDPWLITVGAVDDRGTRDPGDDHAVTWSSHGLTQEGHAKPDVMAPGYKMVSILASRGVPATLQQQHPELVVDGNYFRMGGTSMAAPVVSGVAALVLAANPGLTPDEVKWILMNTTRPYSGQPSGTPGIAQADQAVAAALAGTYGMANAGLQANHLLGSTGTVTGDSTLGWLTLGWLTQFN